MRQEHVAGDKVFVDYSGKKIAIVDPRTGEIREAELFIAVVGASSFTYAGRRGRRRCPTGSMPMCACSASSAACRARSCPTI